MEEILASIRRIISDDEAKPAAEAARPEPAAKAAPAKSESPKPERPAAAAKPAMGGIPPSRLSVARPAPVPAAPPPVEKNSQAEIDAMMAEFDSPAPKAETPLDDEVFELTEQMAVPASSFQKIEPEDDLEFAESPQPPQAPPAADHRSPMPPTPFTEAHPAPQQQPIMSSSTVSAVESAFNALATTVLSNNARTLEDLVKEMLRPLLKSWLDDNLPSLVERIVRAEIERVARGR